MRGWFDAFRCDGGPTLYNFNNRTSVTGDVTIITFLTLFSTLYVAFLIIFPGIRKERFTTFCAVTLSLFVGATILITLFGSSWQIAKTSTVSTYRSFSKEKIVGDIGVRVGLKHVNITLQVSSNNSPVSDIDFNERFMWINAQQMKDSYTEALVRGLPFPILRVAEYFVTGQDGLAWGVQYRAAGYFAMIMLWTSFAIWMLMNLMLIVVPRYGAVLMTTCGFMLISTCCGYLLMLPEIPLVIRIEGKELDFRFGWCYWLVLSAGGICLLTGVIITTIEIIYPHSFSTILEVDYDTPYDRYIIIEDSRDRKCQKKRSTSKLEETENRSLGSRILSDCCRRLNSKSRDGPSSSSKMSSPEKQNFQLESSWRYPFRNSNLPEPRLSSTVLSKASAQMHEENMRYESPKDQVTMW